MSDRLPDRVRASVSGLSPGYFALVMASGIISIGMELEGRRWLSVVLLGVSAVGFVVIVLLNLWRILSYGERVKADFFDPNQAFGFFTLVAAAGVLGARLCLDDRYGWATALFVVALLGWVVLGYAVPWATMLDRSNRPTVATANGTWFMWVVASQSVAVLAATLEPHLLSAHHVLALLAVIAWAVGIFLYGAEGMFVALREMLYKVDFTPSYWVAMGAASITVLGGARIMASGQSEITDAVRSLIGGVSVMFWAFATWLIPILTAALWWRHRVQGVPVAYDPTEWSMVFPLGMYAVASMYIGSADGLQWVALIGKAELWVALLAWVVTFVAMAEHLYQTLATGRRPL